MRIGIIGAGAIGATLARKLSSAGHAVLLANSRGPDTIVQFAVEAGATAVPVVDAVKNVDVVIVSIPEKSIAYLPKDLFAGASDDDVVVDTGNYYPSRDGRITEIEGGLTESEWVARVLGRPVVKAFNHIVANSLATRGVPPAPQDASASPSPVTRRAPSRWYSTSSRRLASTALMPARSPTPGGSSPARRRTLGTSIRQGS